MRPRHHAAVVSDDDDRAQPLLAELLYGRVRAGIVKEFPLPRRDARPFGVTVDAANNVWYTDLGGWLGMLPAKRARGN